MEFTYSDRCHEYRTRLLAFMDEWIYPNESLYDQQIHDSGDPHFYPPIMDTLKTQAKKRGLWNLFQPHSGWWGDGFSNLDYAPLAEIMGRSRIASEACNCAAPDTGNMEVLTMFGSAEQQQRWLRPLLDG
jgi:acyl-CoA dehydrogenase